MIEMRCDRCGEIIIGELKEKEGRVRLLLGHQEFRRLDLCELCLRDLNKTVTKFLKTTAGGRVSLSDAQTEVGGLAAWPKRPEATGGLT